MSTTNGFEDLKYLTAEEIAEMLRVSKATVYRWAEQGKLPSFRMGRVVRFNLGEVKAVLARGVDPQAGT